MVKRYYHYYDGDDASDGTSALNPRKLLPGQSGAAAVSAGDEIEARNGVDFSGPIVATFAVSGTGFFSYSGPGNAPGDGQNLSRAMSAGVHLTISGGTSRSVTPIVSPV